MSSYNIDDILSEVKKRREENEKEILAEKSRPVPAQQEPSEPAEEPKTAPEMPKEEKNEPENTVAEQPEEAGGAEDIFEITEDESAPMSNEPEAAEEIIPPKKGSKALKIVIAVLIALIVMAVAGLAVANNWINSVVKNSDNTVATTESEWKGMSELEESFEPIQETEATELSSLEDMIRTLYYNGTPASSTHVLNVLLIGEDTRGEEILDEGTRADSAILVSVNIDTKTITLTSILRDSWAYWETTEGDEETGSFGKINGAMSSGDINAYINCLEKLYKVKIDNYAIVNFSSFEKIVDKLGGVKLKITEDEINEINNHPKRYGNVTIEKTFEGTEGKMKLSGKQALAYCRIRKIDSDNARADRQKTCLIQIFKQTKNASAAKLISVVNALIPYVKTGFGKSEIVKIARYAISQGWLGFDIVTESVPQQNLKGGVTRGSFGGQWIWRADFPADAYVLQTRLYGKSSITLAKIRVDTKTVRQEGFFSEGYRATSATYVNEAYGEATTLKEKKKNEEKVSSEEAE